MTTAFWIWTHLSSALLLGYLLRPLLNFRRPRIVGPVGLAVISLVCLIPAGQTDVSGFILAHTGTLSIPLLIFVTFEFLCDWKLAQSHERLQRNANFFWATAGLILYPSALGFFAFDSYQFGYLPIMGWILLALSVTAVISRQELLGFCLLAVIFAHGMELFESRNLWDYLIDPWFCITAALKSGRCLIRPGHKSAARALSAMPDAEESRATP